MVLHHFWHSNLPFRVAQNAKIPNCSLLAILVAHLDLDIKVQLPNVIIINILTAAMDITLLSVKNRLVRTFIEFFSVVFYHTIYHEAFLGSSSILFQQVTNNASIYLSPSPFLLLKKCISVQFRV